jgi:hypothetical protein
MKAWHVARSGIYKMSSGFLVADTEGKRLVGRPMRRRKENFNFDIEYEIAVEMGLSWQGL